MFRFTIRDVLWLTLAVALGLSLGLGWWRDNQRLTKTNEELRRENVELGIHAVASATYPRGEARIREIHEAAKVSPPEPDEAEEVFFAVRHDPDFRIRVKAMAVLPYVPEREEAIDVLLEALRDRDPKRSADGCVPLYAAKYLSHMKAERAMEEIEDWLAYLKEEQPYSDEVRQPLIEHTEKFLAALAAAPVTE